MPLYYPIYLNLAGSICVVVGGGKVAERKVSGLLDAGAAVRVVSPALTTTLQALAEQEAIEHRAAEYGPGDLHGAALVFAATNRREVNARVAEDARENRIPVTIADAPNEGSFIAPSVVRRGDFCLSISTGANNPMLAARLADEMEQRFGPEFGEFVELLGTVRDRIKQWTEDSAARRSAVAAVLDHEAAVRALLKGGRPEDAMSLALSAARQAAAAGGPAER